MSISENSISSQKRAHHFNRQLVVIVKALETRREMLYPLEIERQTHLQTSHTDQ